MNKKYLIYVLFFFVVLAATFCWASTPVVYESWELKSCVKVVAPNDQYSCQSLPKRYIHVWTK